jgi:branched-chain amino acid transport system substrate-binding protein
MNMKQMIAATGMLLAVLNGTARADISIGLMATLSGPQGVLGQDIYDGFMLGVTELGGKLGGQKVTIIKEDDQSKPDLAAQIATKLIEKDHVPIIVGVTASNIMMAVHKRITSAGVVLIGTLAGPTPIAGASCSENFFSTSWNNDALHEAMGAYVTSAGYKKVVAIAPNIQSGTDAVNGFKHFYNVPLADEIYVQWNQSDYSSEIGSIQAAQADAVYAFLPGGMGINFVKQYQQAGLLGVVPLVSTSTIDGTTLPALKTLAVGAVTGGSYATDLKNPENERFVSGFVAAYGRLPSLYAAQSYDAAKLLDSAITKVNGDISNLPAFRAALKKADFNSVSGPFRYNTNHFPIRDFFRVDVAKDASGQAVFVTKATVLKGHADSYALKCPLAD